MYVRADVLEWSADRDMKEVSETKMVGRGKNNKVKTVIRNVKVTIGTVLLQITVADSTGKTVIAEKEYEGEFSMEGSDADKETVIENAAQNAIAQFLADITPKSVTYSVRLDDSDKKQETMLKTAEKGNIGQAADDMEAYISSNPTSFSAHFNLAVF
jgi:hypothetical protein